MAAQGTITEGASPDWIRTEIARLMSEREQLDNRISALQSQLQSCTASSPVGDQLDNSSCSITDGFTSCANGFSTNGLSSDMIYRYSRQLLLPDFGVEGQYKLSRSRVLVIGAGGLGSPAAMYLASCGVGCLGIVDGDFVELNNLHRQIIHTESYVGKPKVQSAAAACRAINSSIKVVEHQELLHPSNALKIVNQYDVVVDATDNLPSRYMISDCCVVLKKPLISGAALGLEGQLTVYNHKGSPCYRCLFPTPPPSAACQRCSDSGVLGVVPGVIGCMQALEAIKIAADVGEPLSGRMLLFDALSACVRIVKIRGRSPACIICGENSSFTKEEFERFDYENFTQSPMSDRTRPKVTLLPESARITTKEYKEVLDKNKQHVLLDVRPVHQFKITSLPNSVNIPLSDLEKELPKLGPMVNDSSLYVICRRGNTSQTAVQLLHQKGLLSAKDIIGGLESWAKEIDPKFPVY
ncbi:Adenylyltransferase and sulfurtransferase MOCS3 [Rhynchospora pubera]|uniref:Adenylyltransferase and sulfurtransferase MOCS3 n=1 Tax=Rhynchospora pubera TaxID=906938 RepID=A0AAV8FJT9_9POAL|nr:Adenylyltransferase and sulfurtransferase MOCS3 [Rhynchospora pubera]